MQRLFWRLKLLFLGISWRASKYVDHRPPTPAEIKRGQEIAKELGLISN